MHLKLTGVHILFIIVSKQIDILEITVEAIIVKSIK